MVLIKLFLFKLFFMIYLWKRKINIALIVMQSSHVGHLGILEFLFVLGVPVFIVALEFKFLKFVFLYDVVINCII